MKLNETLGKICKYGTPLGCSQDDEEEKKEPKHRKSK